MREWGMFHYCHIDWWQEILDENRPVCWSIVVKKKPTLCCPYFGAISSDRIPKANERCECTFLDTLQQFLSITPEISKNILKLPRKCIYLFTSISVSNLNMAVDTVVTVPQSTGPSEHRHPSTQLQDVAFLKTVLTGPFTRAETSKLTTMKTGVSHGTGHFLITNADNRICYMDIIFSLYYYYWSRDSHVILMRCSTERSISWPAMLLTVSVPWILFLVYIIYY
jgi:hypothetical protein